jgi:hypothetical protein
VQCSAATALHCTALHFGAQTVPCLELRARAQPLGEVVVRRMVHDRLVRQLLQPLHQPRHRRHTLHDPPATSGAFSIRVPAHAQRWPRAGEVRAVRPVKGRSAHYSAPKRSGPMLALWIPMPRGITVPPWDTHAALTACAAACLDDRRVVRRAEAEFAEPELRLRRTARASLTVRACVRG